MSIALYGLAGLVLLCIFTLFMKNKEIDMWIDYTISLKEQIQALTTERDVARALAGMHISSPLTPSLGTEAPSVKGNDEEHDGA